MKKIVFSVILSLFIVNAFCQTPTLSREYYLQKSKKQQNAGWILLGGGTAMAVLGMVISGQNERQNDLGYGPNFDTGAWLFVAGIGTDLVSIPFFINSSQNAQRAATIRIQNQHILIPPPTGTAFKFQPAITLTINLR